MIYRFFGTYEKDFLKLVLNPKRSTRRAAFFRTFREEYESYSVFPAGDPDRAIAAYRSALAEPDAPVRTHRSLGQSLLREGRRGEARGALESYLLAAPDAYDRPIIQYQIESLR